MDIDSADIILTVRDLEIFFKDDNDDLNQVIHKISFDLYKGEILGIVGESGSGKSVTSLSIMQLLSKSKAVIGEESSIVFCESTSCVDLLSLDDAEMVAYRGSQIAMIFQEPMTSMNPTMKSGKQVLEAVLLHNNLDKEDGKKRVLELFESVDLPEPNRIYNSYPHQLSGGQIQRIMIAMAIAGNPKILIADEPTTALDVTVQKEILQLIKTTQSKLGNSTIFISHDLAVVSQLCDRVLVMQKGNIVEYGKTEDIFRNPQNPYTKGLIASRPPDGIKMYQLPTVDYFINDPNTSQEAFVKQWRISNEDIEKRIHQNDAAPIVLEVKNLSKIYKTRTSLFSSRKTHAVDGVNLSLHQGEILGVVGESGSGKSTLSQMIGRLIKPTEGEIFYKNEDIWQYNSKRLKNYRRQCQTIFQDPYGSLNPRMKIGAAIMEPMEVHKLLDKKGRKDKCIDLLENVGLKADHFDRYPHEFSGGQRQRIVIARALSLEPKLLLCDECVSALDVSIQSKVINLLLELKKKFDLSLLFISHDLSVVQFISDRIMVMKDGKVIESGNALSLYDAPKEVYTQNLIEAIPKFKFTN